MLNIAVFFKAIFANILHNFLNKLIFNLFIL